MITLIVYIGVKLVLLD